jgi:hypothetical protein
MYVYVALAMNKTFSIFNLESPSKKEGIDLKRKKCIQIRFLNYLYKIKSLHTGQHIESMGLRRCLGFL